MTTDPPNIIPFGNPPKKRPMSLLERLKLNTPRTPEEIERAQKVIEESSRNLQIQLHVDPSKKEDERNKLYEQFLELNKEGAFYRKGESQVERIGDIDFEKVSEHPAKEQVVITGIKFNANKKIEVEILYLNHQNEVIKENCKLDGLEDLRDFFSIAVGGDEENRNRLRSIIEPMFMDNILKLEP